MDDDGGPGGGGEHIGGHQSIALDPVDTVVGRYTGQVACHGADPPAMGEQGAGGGTADAAGCTQDQGQGGGKQGQGSWQISRKAMRGDWVGLG